MNLPPEIKSAENFCADLANKHLKIRPVIWPSDYLELVRQRDIAIWNAAKKDNDRDTQLLKRIHDILLSCISDEAAPTEDLAHRVVAYANGQWNAAIEKAASECLRNNNSGEGAMCHEAILNLKQKE